MILRFGSVSLAIAACLATLPDAAEAQYRPGAYVPAPPPVYRDAPGPYGNMAPLPPVDDDDDDDLVASAPPGREPPPYYGGYRNPPPGYRDSPPAYGAPPAGSGNPQAGYPGPQPNYAAPQPGYGNPPPVVRYDQQPAAAAPRPDQAPQQPGLSQVPIFGPLLSPFDPNRPPPSGPQYGSAPADGMRPPGSVGPAPQGNPQGAVVASLPPEEQPDAVLKELPPQFKRQFVDFQTKEPVGTIIIDTPNTYLYLVLANGKAMRYGIGVGRDGFTWTGTERISRMAEWPDWHPPAEMIERQPYLPRFMAGGEGNPLGARAMYLGKTLYRIHGTNQPSTIGTFVSSGCIRLVNEDVADLYSRVQVGTRVVVWPGKPPVSAQYIR